MQAKQSNEFYQQSGVAMTCRAYEEYVRMFALQEMSLSGLHVLDVAGGASSSRRPPPSRAASLPP